MKILVTGSSGMLGSRLVSELLKVPGGKVYALDIVQPSVTLAGVEYIDGDIMNVEFLKGVLARIEAPDYIIHLAARTDLTGENIFDYKINYESALLLCDLTAGVQPKGIIFASTQLVYDLHSPKGVYSAPPNHYGTSKLISENIVQKLSKTKFTIIRPTTIWGPGQNKHYNSFIDILKKGLYFHSGFKSRYKSYSYVGNAAYQLRKIVEHYDKVDHGRIIYLCDYTSLELKGHINAICKAMGYRKPIQVPLTIATGIAMFGDILGKVGIRFPFNRFRLRNINAEYQYNTDFLEDITGELPYSYEEALAEYISWVKEEL